MKEKTFHCFIRTAVLRDGWSSVHETPTFVVKALDMQHAAKICALVPSPQLNATVEFHNFSITDVKAGKNEWYTTRPDKGGKWCELRVWDANVDLATF